MIQLIFNKKDFFGVTEENLPSIYAQFIFVSGTLFDIIITTIGVLFKGGKEGNPLLNWIYPNEIMILFFILSNVCFMVLLFVIYHITKNQGLQIAMFIIGMYKMFFGGFSWIY